jgi:hypothetical protein
MSASLIYIFTCIFIIKGSMDRMNIAVITVIAFLLYSKFHRIAFLLTVIYVIHGIFTFSYGFITKHIRSDFDGYFILVFSIIYFLFLIIETFKKQNLLNETKHNYTSF